MLKVNPKERITIEKALEHNWIKSIPRGRSCCDLKTLAGTDKFM